MLFVKTQFVQQQHKYNNNTHAIFHTHRYPLIPLGLIEHSTTKKKELIVLIITKRLINSRLIFVKPAVIPNCFETSID